MDPHLSAQSSVWTSSRCIDGTSCPLRTRRLNVAKQGDKRSVMPQEELLKGSPGPVFSGMEDDIVRDPRVLLGHQWENRSASSRMEQVYETRLNGTTIDHFLHSLDPAASTRLGMRGQRPKNANSKESATPYKRAHRKDKQGKLLVPDVCLCLNISLHGHLRSNTHCRDQFQTGKGSTVKKVVEGLNCTKTVPHCSMVKLKQEQECSPLR
ncbi:hypothetical protein SCLCIDRAFT_999990 [Scleroderma citrinum Foug A]|uniref:Uncharacterized protein n=1 Tax=Scleroderma citrinum Foug A TaxID=1036808 RepID=A0A0C3EJG4_9AGAM|nr:hypothetical protein SCLCIDRAFT_999990 [Scleroderma citrinum Foug A]